MNKVPKDWVPPDHMVPTLVLAQRAIENGATVYFQWTCHHCKVRQTFTTPNAVHKQGQCEECKGISDIMSPASEVSMIIAAGSPIDAVMKVLGGE